MARLYCNIDSNSFVHPFLKGVIANDYFYEEMLYPMVDTYKNLGITDLIFNTFCQISSTHSEFWTDYVDKYYATKENGIDVDYKEIYNFSLKLERDYSIDVYKVWFDRCRKQGMNPWISIRMNDCHISEPCTSFLRSDFHIEAEKNGWILGDEYGYYRICLNYGISEVRTRMLLYIREQIQRYDVYGIELDFQREARCFKYLSENMDECRMIMTEFIKNVKKEVLYAEALHGHKIKIMVRLPRDIKQSNLFGFDPEAWDKDRAVDIISPCARFLSNDSGISPVEWKEKLPNTQIIACVEMLVSAAKGYVKASPEICRGLAAAYFADGSDGMYLYNYFWNPDSRNPAEALDFLRMYKVITSVGDFNKIYDYPIRFAVLNQEDEYAGGITYKPLPIISSSTSNSVNIITGKIPFGKCVSLIVGYKNKEPSVYFNGTELRGGREIKLSFIPGIGVQPSEYVDTQAICVQFLISDSNLSDFKQNVCFGVKNGSSVEWVEIDVI